MIGCKRIFHNSVKVFIPSVIVINLLAARHSHNGKYTKKRTKKRKKFLYVPSRDKYEATHLRHVFR